MQAFIGFLDFLSIIAFFVSVVWFIIALILKKKIKVPVIVFSSSISIFIVTMVIYGIYFYPNDKTASDFAKSEEAETVVKSVEPTSAVPTSAEPKSSEPKSSEPAKNHKSSKQETEQNNGTKSDSVKGGKREGVKDSVEPLSLESEESLERETKQNVKKEKIKVEYQEVFYVDLLSNWDSYVGKRIVTSFPFGSYNERKKTIDSDEPTDYDIYECFTVYASNYKQFDSGEYLTAKGLVCEETEYDYVLKEAEIIQSGNESKKKYLDEKNIYDERLRVEEEEYESKFKEESATPSYDELSRYPDTYEETKIKVTVKITEVKPDGIIFSGSYMAEMNGKEIVIYDDRKIKEPKLLEKDTVTIYGYGNGLTTIKIQETSGLIPKTVDKYTVPSVNIKYCDIE